MIYNCMVETFEDIEAEAKTIALELKRLSEQGPTAKVAVLIQNKLEELKSLGPRIDNLQ